MCGVVAIFLLAVAVQAHVKELAANHAGDTQEPMDKLVGKLADNMLTRVHSPTLDETTLGKPGNLALSKPGNLAVGKPGNLAINNCRTSLFGRQSAVSLGNIASFALGASRPQLGCPIVHAAMAPADLTPAVDKFTTLPALGENIAEVDFDSLDSRAMSKTIDPFKMVEKDLESLSQYVVELVESENPVLTKAASHFFEKRQGKRFRPTIVALIGRALSPGGTTESIVKRQIQLGQITEMIHVASLIHDDVLDVADTRRGGAAVHAMYSNKVAVLAGDFLLARASMLLARLQHLQVVEVMAAALEALVQGEIMQARSKKEDLTDMNQYLRKSYFKTASLICNSCKSTALLAGYKENDNMTVAAEEFGYHLGMAYQIVDDILDYTGASSALGKPAQADMQLGLATAPILFASESEPALKPLIERRFKNDGDVTKALELAKNTDCVQKSRDLAEFHAQKGIDALMQFPQSESRLALLRLMQLVLSRKS